MTLAERLKPSKNRSLIAIVLSIVAHGMLLVAVSQISFAPARQPAPDTVLAVNIYSVPLRPELLPEPLPEPREEPPPETVLEPDPAPVPAPPAPLLPAEAIPTAGETSNPAAPTPENPPPTEEASDPDDASESTTAREDRPIIQYEIDFDALRDDAVDTLVERLEREFNSPSFSLDDLAADDPAADYPGGSDEAGGKIANIFTEAEELARGGRSFFSPGSGRSRAANAVSKFCNELTGGIGFFGIFNICADPGERADLFGHARPAYMERLPVCTEEQGMQLVIETGELEPVAEIKCVLVPRSERGDYRTD